MEALWGSQALLWLAVVLLGFLVLGLIRQIALLRWRIDQLAATTPSRVGRSGLEPGSRAPAFTLERVGGGTLSLAELTGRRLLLVFTEPGCGPCGAVVPALNGLERKHGVQPLAISAGDRAESAEWAEAYAARFPVLCQNGHDVSRRYQAYATPFAFLIDENGLVAAKGIVNNDQHVRFLLDSARNERKPDAALEKEERP